MNPQELIRFHRVEKRYGPLRAVRQADFSIRRGEVFGLVGESGSGKSTIANMLIGLTPPSDGTISYMEKPLWRKGSFHMPRPGELQIVFQDPQSSLNPRMTVREILLEPLYAFRAAERKEKGSPERLASLIKQVGLKEEHLSRYPHEFSGGQRQRIAIARALITDPSFLILDEPTSALDVSVQAQILNLLKRLKRERNLTYLFISHNMSVIRYMCDRIAVIYKGKIVEIAPAAEMFRKPGHPYTRILLSSLPGVYGKARDPLSFAPPVSEEKADACIFYEKCPLRRERCLEAPAFVTWEGDWGGACHFRN
ncbi:peptide/nickel transport system ATP-binding protein/oligopeptide transport system ATP-binding protein [Planifilum fimeticola]|uniref:Peptide/nickel transport system ATP-binding protein/oligopeptide transport system ATP-binding protein n=1 Tax=Planifilum fimeticola TaxID=201975 RepID=A0A2T0LJ52_9BACL|nr:oligopeptide/dipeptide ABC transporter ATP-binding protein [Planifilum fimeticola]PRX42535.1 peptide/nickel transport system ATP-binding protein/oligopeptide transport system ATP-binding protein [Planifilum fimeticola]